MRGLFYKEDYKEEFVKGSYKSVFDHNKNYVRIEPYPTLSELEDFYEGSYFEEGFLVEHDYLDKELIYRATYLGYISEIFKFLEPKNNLTILEYGCGVGSFVRSLLVSDENNKIGAIDGVDLSKKAVDLASSHTQSERVNFYTLNNFDNKKKYALIAMLEVVEHIPHVEEILKELSVSIETGGILFITTPNYNSFEQRVFKESWRLFCPPEHINFFTKKTLADLLLDCGWEVVKETDEFVFSFSLGIRKKLSKFMPFFLIRAIGWLKKILVYTVFNSILKFIGYEGGKMTMIAKKI